MSTSTLNQSFKERLWKDFYYNMANFDSFGVPINLGAADLARVAQRGSANFRLLARDSGLQTLGSTEPYIPTTVGSSSNLTENWRINLSGGNAELYYQGPPIEISIGSAGTVVDIVVQYRKIITSSTTGNEVMENTNFVTFPINVTFAEPNGTIVVNQLEFELQ